MKIVFKENLIILITQWTYGGVDLKLTYIHKRKCGNLYVIYLN
jgi:hypothetical protein